MDQASTAADLRTDDDQAPAVVAEPPELAETAFCSDAASRAGKDQAVAPETASCSDAVSANSHGGLQGALESFGEEKKSKHRCLRPTSWPAREMAGTGKQRGWIGETLRGLPVLFLLLPPCPSPRPELELAGAASRGKGGICVKSLRLTLARANGADITAVAAHAEY